ncbi:hypothetical protein D3C87_1221400 [compost metagenome]
MMNETVTRRDKYVAMKAGEWAQKGGELRDVRLCNGLTISEVAAGIGVSPSTLGRFEKGYPVRSAAVIEKAYILFLQLGAFREGTTIPTQFGEGARLAADYLIDQDLGETGKITITKKEYVQVAEIDTGDPDLNAELAIKMCEETGGDYFFTY